MFSYNIPARVMKQLLCLAESEVFRAQQRKKEGLLCLLEGLLCLLEGLLCLLEGLLCLLEDAFHHTVTSFILFEKMCIFRTQRQLSLAAFRLFCLP